MSAKIAAIVTYQKAASDVSLEYDSKNKQPIDTVTINEDVSRTTAYIREFTDDITLVDTPDVGQIYRENPANSVSIGDEVAVGGKVFATGKFLVENLHDYKGIQVSGSHMVNEDNTWVRVEDSKHGKSLGDDEHVVYVFGSENRRILINDILFTDYFEVKDQEQLLKEKDKFFDNWKTFAINEDSSNVNTLNAN